LAKFINICLFCLIVISLCMPIFVFLFDMNINDALNLFYCNCLVSFQASAICLLTSSLQNYFQKSQSLISTILIPLLIPQIIICGTIIHDQQISLMMLALGILIVTGTVAIYFSSLLLKSPSTPRRYLI
jgi:ABC-type transport system involved in cytochrome c biogenesis permease component